MNYSKCAKGGFAKESHRKLIRNPPKHVKYNLKKAVDLRIQRSKFRYLSKNECLIPFHELSNCH